MKYTFLMLIILNSIIYGQHKNVKVWGTINAYDPQECSIIIDPNNTNNMLASANSNHYFYSTDGGNTWKHGSLFSSNGVLGDPSIAIGNNGTAYFFHLTNSLKGVGCHKLSSFGGNWTQTGFFGNRGTKEIDKEWGVINQKNNYLYVAWTEFDKHGSQNPFDSTAIMLSRSINQGSTWSTPIQISNKKGDARGGNNSCHAPMPAIGPNNEVYVTWVSPNGLMFDKSLDEGVTWLNNDINVTPYRINWLTFNVAGIQRTPNFPVINCDISGGKHNGNIYICWADQRNGSTDTDIFMTKSVDGGKTWTNAKKVNNDQSKKHQFFPWMTIDQTTGYLYFVFYDRRNYDDQNTDVYMAYSKDGGESFENFKVSETPFYPTTQKFIGDYIGISAHNNVIRPIWTRVDNNQLSLWTAMINMESLVNIKNENTIPETFEILSIYPNPFNASVKINYKLYKSGFVKLEIYDVLGKKVDSLINNYQGANTYEISWEATSFSSGIYFVNLIFEDKLKTHKIVLSK